MKTNNKARAAAGTTIDLDAYRADYPIALAELKVFQDHNDDWRHQIAGCHQGRFPSGMSSDLFGFIRVIRNHVTARTDVLPDLTVKFGADSIPVVIGSQGGNWVPGTAVGRMGKKILVTYRIKSGEQRERWFSPDRYEIAPQFNLGQLPKWKTITCAMLMFPQPRPLKDIDQTDRVCRHCKSEHDYVWGRRENDQTMVIGMKSKRSIVKA